MVSQVAKGVPYCKGIGRVQVDRKMIHEKIYKSFTLGVNVVMFNEGRVIDRLLAEDDSPAVVEKPDILSVV